MNTFKINLCYRLYSDVWVDNTTLSKLTQSLFDLQSGHSSELHAFFPVNDVLVNVVTTNSLPLKLTRPQYLV